jgi:hypothetical protein
MLAAFLGYSGNGTAGRSKSNAAIGSDIAMRFFAHEQHGGRALAPQAEIEGEPADHGYDGIHYFGREAGELHHRDGLAVRRQPEQMTQHFRRPHSRSLT